MRIGKWRDALLLGRLSLFLAFVVFGQGCALYQQRACAGHPEEACTEFPVQALTPCFNSKEFDFAYDRVAHPIYCFTKDHSKPPVLLLHELPGLSSETLRFGEFLSKDFTVYAPQMLGRLNESQPIRARFASVMNGEWTGLENGTSEIVTWLRGVTHAIAGHHPNQPIGVIGNCFTGAIPLTLLTNHQVKAIVLAQPTLPMPVFYYSEEDKRSLGISSEELAWAKSRQDVRVYGVRFELDCVSPREKKVALREFGDRYIDAEICRAEYQQEDNVVVAHSTLVRESVSPGLVGHAAMKRRQEVRQFLLDPVGFRRGVGSCSLETR